MKPGMNVIIICPCCATPKDVEALPKGTPGWGTVNRYACTACGQRWAMDLDLDRITEHALT